VDKRTKNINEIWSFAMATTIVDRDREEVIELVEKYGRCRWNDSIRKIEELGVEIANTRGILARVLNAVADKGMFSEDELAKIIRGY